MKQHGKKLWKPEEQKEVVPLADTVKDVEPMINCEEVDNQLIDEGHTPTEKELEDLFADELPIAEDHPLLKEFYNEDVDD